MLVWKGGEWINPQTAQSFLCFSLSHPTGTHIRKTLTGWVTPATEKTPPCNSGGFTLKGSAMKKYIPVDFDEKGNAVLGRERNTPTSNGFIPTTWAPGGGDDMVMVTINLEYE